MRKLTPGAGGREFYVYVMLSETQTKFGRALRHFGKITYNHASIAFDGQLHQLYSFARLKKGNPLSAGLVREHVDRFTLRRESRVNVRIYRLRVTREQHLAGRERIRQIMLDPDGYMYNLFSVLSFPLLHGVETYKAYTCAEFVAHMLLDMRVEMADGRPCCGYTPEDLGKSIGAEVFFEGNLLDYCTYRPENAGEFFESVGYRQVAKTSCAVTLKLLYRMIRYKSRVTGVLR